MDRLVAHFDYETRSVIDLKKAGLDVYAKHCTTEVLCLAYCLNEGPVDLWVLGEPLPSRLKGWLLDPKVIIAAHNASFEFYIYNFICVPKYGWPPLPISRFDCTMIRGYAMGLPGHLSNAAMAAGLKQQKDLKGQRVMLQLCKPRNGPLDNCYNCHGSGVYKNATCAACVEFYEPHTAPEKFKILYTYCKQDIFVERAYDKRILPLSKVEKKLWGLDQKINYRGVYVDRPAIEKALLIVNTEKLRLNTLMQKATKNQVATCNAAISLKNWLNTFDLYKGARYSSDGPPSKLKGEKEHGILKWYKGDLKVVQGVGKDVCFDLLEMELPAGCRKAIDIKLEAAKSSTAKLQAMIDGASPDGRVRGCFQFNGAASTQRWAGRRIQFQNMVRPTIKQKEIEEICEHLVDSSMSAEDVCSYINIFHGAPMTRIADCLRAMVMAEPGNKLICADFNSIEGRGLAWLAGEEKALTIYRTHGKMYHHTACQIYGFTNINDITKDMDEYLVGKVATLALGYQGGVGAFQSMAKNYFIKVPDSQADQIKKAWRIANPAIVQYWHDIEKAAISAVEYAGEKFAVGPVGRKVIFLQRGSFLFCRLPSGRAICYPYPKMKRVKTPWGEMKNALTYKGDDNYQFVTKVAYGGLLVENITQATCRDLLAEAMFRVEAAGYPVILHIHDEIVCEVKKAFGTLQEVEKIMGQVPEWAKGMPISAEGWVGKRFRK